MGVRVLPGTACAETAALQTSTVGPPELERYRVSGVFSTGSTVRVELRVTLSQQDLAFLDAWLTTTGLRSRSAALPHAVRLLDHGDLERDYAAAWEEWVSSGQGTAWEVTTSDG